MTSRWLTSWCLVALSACLPGPEPQADLASTAERFFRGVYGCVEADLSEVASPDVRMSYPIFAERFGAPVLEGLAAVEGFATSFCQHWLDPTITVDDVIEGDGRVVLVWSYSASSRVANSTPEVRTSWGGISVFQFDEQGRVLMELGEESTPGPYGRITETR